jgi:hypothetical protein
MLVMRDGCFSAQSSLKPYRKDAKDAEEKKSFTAEGAKAAKETDLEPLT